MMLLLTSGHSPWLRAELQRELPGSKGDPIDVTDAIVQLYGAALVHVSGDPISPTRAARWMDELRL